MKLALALTSIAACAACAGWFVYDVGGWRAVAYLSALVGACVFLAIAIALLFEWVDER